MPKPKADLPDTQVIPEPTLEKRSRRAFTTDYKLRIVAEADNCAYGQLGALLRRENIYSSQIREWRQELVAHGVEKLSNTQPGPAPTKTLEARRVEQLEKENSRLRKRLQMTEDCLDLQKKPYLNIWNIWGQSGIFGVNIWGQSKNSYPVEA